MVEFCNPAVKLKFKNVIIYYWEARFGSREQNYLLHNPGGAKPLPVLLFLHGAHTYIYPETLWWDIEKLLENNRTAREEFIVIAPFGSVGEPVVHPSEWLKRNRFQIEEPCVKCLWAPVAPE